MPKRRRTPWVYRQWSLLVEAPTPRPIGPRVGLFVIAGVIGVLGALYLVAAGTALIADGASAQTGGRYGPRSAWITLGGGVGITALAVTMLVLDHRKTRQVQAILRLRADGLSVLPSGRRATRPTVEVTVPWDDVVGVTLEEIDGRERVAVRAVVDGAETTLLAVDLVDARTAVAVVDHFVRQPADREAIGRRRGERRVVDIVEALQAEVRPASERPPQA
ncbi:hypothetical protein [Mumia sp. Pv 4-285]|uniref:hypothetical protein n=1 Tax=Mumia qirimensis TaxID=3234852 RepID=UPI00351CE198